MFALFGAHLKLYALLNHQRPWRTEQLGWGRKMLKCAYTVFLIQTLHNFTRNHAIQQWSKSQSPNACVYSLCWHCSFSYLLCKLVRYLRPQVRHCLDVPCYQKAPYMCVRACVRACVRVCVYHQHIHEQLVITHVHDFGEAILSYFFTDFRSVISEPYNAKTQLSVYIRCLHCRIYLRGSTLSHVPFQTDYIPRHFTPN